MDENNRKEEAGAGGEGKDEGTLSELEKENQRLRKENELLKEYRASLPLKERLYDRIPLTVKQLDIIIGVLLGLLGTVVVLGLIDRCAYPGGQGGARWIRRPLFGGHRVFPAQTAVLVFPAERYVLAKPAWRGKR